MSTYNRYPGIDKNYQFPPEVRQALIDSGEIVTMTENLIEDHVSNYDKTVVDRLIPYQKIDVIPPGNPVAPTLSLVMGAVVVKATNLDTKDDPMPLDFSHYNVEVGPDWNVKGTITGTDGSTSIYGLPAGLADIRLVAVDTSNNASNPGRVASITVVPIETAEQVREDYLAKQAEIDETIADFQGSVAEAIEKAEAAESAAQAAEARAAEANSRSMSSLSNGNFEEGDKYWNLEQGAVLNSDARSGVQAIELSPGGRIFPVSAVSVLEGQIWELQYFAKPDNPPTGQGVLARFSKPGEEQSGPYLNTHYVKGTPDAWTGSGSVRVTIPSGMEQLSICIVNPGAETVSYLIDDITLRDVTDVVRLERAAIEARTKAEAAEARSIAVELAQTGIQNRLRMISEGNVFPDPLFSVRQSYDPWVMYDNGLEKSGTGAQQGAYFPEWDVSVTPGDEYYVAFDRQTVSGSGGYVVLQAQLLDANQIYLRSINIVQASSDGNAENSLTIPSDTHVLRFGFYTQPSMSSTTKVRVTKPVVARKTSTVMIADGAVDANKIRVNQDFTAKIFGAEHGVIRYLTATEKALFLKGLDAIGESWIDGVNIKDAQITARLMNFIKEDGVNRLRIDNDGIILETMTGRAIMRMDPTGFYGFDTSGNTTFKFDPGTGRMLAVNGDFTGDIRVGSTITGALIQTTSSANRGIKLNSGGLVAYNPLGLLTFGVDALTGEASMQSDVNGNVTKVSGKGLVIQRASPDSEAGMEDLVRITGEGVKRIAIGNTSEEGGSDVLIDDTGGVAGETGSFNQLIVEGEDIDAVLDRRPRGIVDGSLSWRDLSGITETGLREYGFLQFSFQVEQGRLYRLNLEPFVTWDRRSGTSYLAFRYTTGNVVPTLASKIMWRPASNNDPALAGLHQFGGVWFLRPHESWFLAGETTATINYLLSIDSPGGIDAPSSSLAPLAEVTVWAEDIGPEISTSGVHREERVTRAGSSTSDSSSKTTIKSYTQTWSSTGVTSLNANGTVYNWKPGVMFQGQSMYYTAGGAKRSHASFGTGSLGQTLAQAGVSAKSVLKIELWVYFDHWHSASGGNTEIGWFDSVTSQTNPTLDGVKNVFFRRKQGRWVDVSSPRSRAQFQAGSLRGLGIRAPGLSTNTIYYASAVGTGSNRPKVRVTYTR